MTSWAGPAFVLQPQGGQAYNSVVVDHSPFLVGRQSDSSLQLAHAAVSGRHAEIVYDGDGWWIVDCGSTNGTFVNGGCVDARARVEVGDLVHFATFGYEIVPAMQSTTEEDSPAIPTHVLTSSVDIKGLAELFNIVRDQHTYPLFQPVFVLANHETYGGRRWGAGCGPTGRLAPGDCFTSPVETRSRLSSASDSGTRLSSARCVATAGRNAPRRICSSICTRWVARSRHSRCSARTRPRYRGRVHSCDWTWSVITCSSSTHLRRRAWCPPRVEDAGVVGVSGSPGLGTGDPTCRDPRDGQCHNEGWRPIGGGR